MVALSIAIMLMNTVLDTVNIANDITKDPTPIGTMGESLDERYENVIMGQDLLKYVDQQNEFTELKNNYSIKIQIGTNEVELKDYLKTNNIKNNLIGKKYKYTYKGKVGDKYIISFSEV